MYGKIFDSMYEGTLYGQWQAIVTFQQMIVLCDSEGTIDMTAKAMSARTSIPLEIIEAGIAVLEAPDPHSRTPNQDGRRIERLDDHRPWGWRIVNHAKYKHLRDHGEVQAQNRERSQRYRDRNKGVGEGSASSRGVTLSNASSRSVTSGNGKSRHADADADAVKARHKGKGGDYGVIRTRGNGKL